jgi:hypothetical protein
LRVTRLFVSIAALSLFAASSACAAPINWEIQMDAFERVFKPHPQCLAKGAAMSEMECTNFRARALKRFQKEWEANAYWKNGAFAPNPDADRRVNSELPK